MRCILLLIIASGALAQLDSNSVTVSSSRNNSLQPDQVVFAVYVSTDITAGLSDVLAAVEPAGLTTANFVSVSSPQTLPIVFDPGTVTPGPVPQPFPRLPWVFAAPVALGKMKDMSSALTDLQRNLALAVNGPRISFSVQGTQVSQQLQQSQACPVGDLINDARAQAQKLATAAGLTVGNILAMLSATASLTTSGVYVGQPVGAIFSGLSPGLAGGAPCAVTVKFALR